MNRLLVGLTGGLASGKSTVARWLAEAGFTVADADLLVAELYAPGAAGAKAIADMFGPEVLDDSGAVDKPALARVVFADDEARQRVEAAIHPLVRQQFAALAASTDGVVVYEATLLVESGHAQNFDLIVTVEAPEATRLLRAVERGMTEAQARARLAAQGTGDMRRAAAHLVIDNSGSLEDLRRQVDRLVERCRQLADHTGP